MASPTRRQPAPRAATISVAAGNSEMTRIPTHAEHACRNVGARRAGPLWCAAVSLLSQTHPIEQRCQQSEEPEGEGVGVRQTPERIEHGHPLGERVRGAQDRKSTRLNSSHLVISYAVFCLK